VTYPGDVNIPDIRFDYKALAKVPDGNCYLRKRAETIPADGARRQDRRSTKPLVSALKARLLLQAAGE